MARERKKASIAGYAGYFKGHYLRSTLEYAYALILEHDDVNWDYETTTFTLADGQAYKPDFDLGAGRFAEVKGEIILDKDLPKIVACQEQHGIVIDVWREKDIRAAFEARGMDYRAAVREWRETAQRTGQDLSGERNPRFGVEASEQCRNLIGSKAAERWANPEYRVKMSRAFVGRDHDHLRLPRSERVTTRCEVCGAEMVLTPAVSKRRRFCSSRCATSTIAQKGADAGAALAADRAVRIRELAFQYAEQNPELVLTCKANRISSTLAECWAFISSDCGVSDFRVLSKAIAGAGAGRKEMLSVLKTHVQNIVRANEN